MSFCPMCGKQLQEGEVCTCQNRSGAAQGAYSQPQGAYSQSQTAQPQGMYTQPQGTSNTMPEFVSDIIELVKGFIKKPADATKEYVNKGDFASSGIIVAICAVVSMFVRLIVMVAANIKAEANASDYINPWDPTTWSKPEPVYSAGEIVLNMFGEVVTTIALAAVFAGVLMLVLNMLVQKNDKVKFGQSLAVIAAASLIELPFDLVASLVRLVPVSLFSWVAGWIGTFGGAAYMIILFFGIKKLVKDDNHMLVTYAITAFAVAVVSTFLNLLGL